jgi:tetratricopeptide (TPR) repeat protein
LFWHHRAHAHEGLAWIQRLILDRDGVDPRWRVRGLFWAANLGDFVGSPAWDEWMVRARTLARQLEDEYMIIATTLTAAARRWVPVEQKIAELEEGLQLARRAGEMWWVAYGLNYLAGCLRLHGDIARAEVVQAEAVPLWRELGANMGLSEALFELGMLAFQHGEGERAIELFEEGMAIGRSAGLARAVSYWSMELATVLTYQGHLGRAASYLREAFELHQRMGDLDGPVRCLCVTARLAQRTGRPELAVRLFGAVEDRRPHLPPHSFTFQERCDDWLNELRAALGPIAFDQAWAAGRTLTHQQAVDVALAEM